MAKGNRYDEFAQLRSLNQFTIDQECNKATKDLRVKGAVIKQKAKVAVATADSIAQLAIAGTKIAALSKNADGLLDDAIDELKQELLDAIKSMKQTEI